MHEEKNSIVIFSKNFYNNVIKNKKKNYAKFSLYKLIALLNTLNKILKSIMFKRINTL